MNNKTMENKIKSWGFPRCLSSNGNIIFKFTDNGIIDTTERDYHCTEGSVKFCLFDKELNKVLFTMDFRHNNPRLLALIPSSERESFEGINLELLFVHDELWRKKGIASYYFSKLQDYAIVLRAKRIIVKPIANDKRFNQGSKENTLDQEELEAFYLKRSTEEMPVRVDIRTT